MWNVSAINDFSHNNPTSAAAVVASMVLFTGKDFQSSAFPNYFSKVDWVALKLQCLYILDMYILHMYVWNVFWEELLCCTLQSLIKVDSTKLLHSERHDRGYLERGKILGGEIQEM